MSSSHRWLIAAALAFCAPASAQQRAPDVGPTLITSTEMTAPARFFAPPMVNPRLALAATAAPAPAVGQRPRESQNVALMIVGGAALVVGAVIDGDAGTIIMIGGGVTGLIGLYRYLR